ncbi:putative Zn-dependent protease [Catalinimonas alkaloidigena]|uniref:matrixin family metalloprotease n=1 Tax=Catalinimonas alkaloidigena TaxID=1075417 RepID=UPI00240588C1|nr:matrixin family metalloprotease [Catalinimonas alkaloidigena]MDF9797723.1 putative Zn-dependent protease [Catalinimonas alkaloidigena]
MMVINAHASNAELSALDEAKYDLIIGITDSALTIGKQYRPAMTIRGLADPDARVLSLSTYKLRQESVNSDEFTINLSKVVKHEIGHVLGLRHCEESENCLMRNGFHFAYTTIDFCPACEEKIDIRYLKIRSKNQ